MKRKFRYDPTTDEIIEVGAAPSERAPADAWNTPKHCESLAVDPSEVPFAMEVDRQNGVPTSYDANGSPIITGPQHYAKYARSWGYVNRASVTKGRSLAPGELERMAARVKEQYE